MTPSTVIPIPGDPRLVISYEVYLIGTTVRPSWLVDYIQATRKPVIYTTDETLEGLYTLYVTAWFAYRPSVKIPPGTHTFSVNLLDKCRKTVIQTSPLDPQPLYYQVGEPPKVINLVNWTHTY